MSRVSERQDQQRMEAERMQKRSAKESQSKTDTNEGQKFGQMMRQRGQKAAQMQGALSKQQAQDGDGAQNQKSDGAHKGNEARQRQLARGGNDHSARLMRQAQNFQGALKKAGQDGSEAKEVRTEAKEESATEGRVGNDERGVELDQRTEVQKERQSEDARIDRADRTKANAAIDANSGGGAEQHDGDDAKKDASHMAVKGQAMAVKQTESVKKSDAPTIAAELLEKLVSEVWHGITASGDHEFHIELKDGALAGAKISVSSKNGKVRLNFSGLDQNTERLLGASEGELMRRFESKGMALDALTFGAKSG